MNKVSESESFIYFSFIFVISRTPLKLSEIMNSRIYNVTQVKMVGPSVILGHIYFRGPPVVIRLTCDCAVADDAVMPIRAESSP